ncbi:MAG TPA: CHAT domain-containing protein [Thermoanaerobaculia bacterium]|nr:CHAT domain-containing protein [Thermoanaerobaculia bacterium]
MLAKLHDELRVVVDETAALAPAARFQRVLHNNELVAKLDPSGQQRAEAAKRYERLKSCSRILDVLLRRYAIQPPVAPEKLADKAAAYVKFERHMRPELTEGQWRRAFDDDLRDLHRQLDSLIDLCAAAVPAASRVVRYDPVDIRIEHVDDSTCRVNGVATLVRITAGEQQQLVADYRKPRADPPNQLTAPLVAFGQKLFKLIAPAYRSGDIRLHLADAGGLAKAPWELLHDGSDFVALQRSTVITRCVDRPPAPLRENDGPLRVLLTISSPAGLCMLNGAEERRRVEDAVEGLVLLGRLELDVAPDGTLDTLRRMLRAADEAGRPFRAWHFIGHGRYDPLARRSELAMEGISAAHWVGGNEFQVLFGAHPPMRFAILNACESGLEGIDDPRSGLASTLIDCGVETVIATQFQISDEAAIILSEEVYGAFAGGHDLLSAVAEARRAIFCRPRGVEWMTPVVFARASQYANTS